LLAHVLQIFSTFFYHGHLRIASKFNVCAPITYGFKAVASRTGCGKKVAPKVFCWFLSKRLEF